MKKKIEIENKIRVKTMSNYIIDTLWENECMRNRCVLWSEIEEASTLLVLLAMIEFLHRYTD